MNLIPRLVKDKETGDLCVQLSMGSQSATLPLPKDFKDWEEVRKSNFLEEFVKEATKNLKKRLPFHRRIK